MVLRKLDLLKEAVEVFVEAIHALPLHWGAWLELSNLVTNIEMVTTFVYSCTLDSIVSLTLYSHKTKLYHIQLIQRNPKEVPSQVIIWAEMIPSTLVSWSLSPAEVTVPARLLD